MSTQKAENYEILATTEDVILADKLEQEYILKYGYKEKGATNYLQITSIGAQFQPGYTPTEEHRQNLREARKNTNNAYGKGDRFKELSTGFEGCRADHVKHFNIYDSIIYISVKTAKPYTKGKLKGFQWVKI